jgi:hypothetical protein
MTGFYSIVRGSNYLGCGEWGGASAAGAVMRAGLLMGKNLVMGHS